MSFLTPNSDPVIALLEAGFLSCFFCTAVFPIYIRWLKAKQIGQFIREEGPQSHQKKAKTPTMGGLCFILGTAIVSISFIFNMDIITDSGRQRALIVLLAAALCGLLGFADDYGKITSQSNSGLSAKLRLVAEFGLGLALSLALYFLNLAPAFISGVSSNQEILKNLPHLTPTWELPYLLIAGPFLLAATSNALNLHDGMDGLAGGTSFFVFITLAIMLYSSGNIALACVSASAAGAILAFLLYNKFPARIFMGDTGSLFIGALMAAIVLSSGLTFWFIPLALIYIVETVSVIMQVTYFKLTKPYTPEKKISGLELAIFKLSHKLPGEGKRLLKMAPIHHHFEAIAQEKNHKEWEVVLVFWFLQIAICSACLIAFSNL